MYASKWKIGLLLFAIIAAPRPSVAFWPFDALGGGGTTTPPPAPAPAARPRVAVTRFELPANLVVPLVSRVETTFLHDGTIAALVRADVVDVVERTRIDAVTSELGLTKDGHTDPAQAAKLGKLLGASHVLVGTLADVDVKADDRAIPYTTRSERAYRGRIRVQYRVVEVESGRVVAADTAEVRNQAPHATSSDDADDFWQRLQGDAAYVLALRVLDAVAPLRVVSVDRSHAELSRGTSSGVATGLVCDVLDARQDAVARITVSQATTTHASGEVDGDVLKIAAGMPCRPQAAPPPEPPAARRDPTEDRW